MKRWDGWGEDSYEIPLGERARELLLSELGSSHSLSTMSLQQVVEAIPASRLAPHELWDIDPEIRLRHARGQSIPDWLAVKSGKIGVVPDAVAQPTSNAEVRKLCEIASERGYRLIPYGGGTSVVGHVSALPSDAPQITVSLRRMNLLIDLDTESQIATLGAGATGPEVEAQLRGRGYTLGHFPQSFEFSTIGGWVVTRSSGQQSLRYGRIEQLFAGGHIETPRGPLDLLDFPASSAGPDLREVVLGSEGRVGILTEVKVRVTPLAMEEDFFGVFFPSWEAGFRCVQELVQNRVPLSMLRLSNPQETMVSLVLAGHGKLVGLLETYLRLRGAGDTKCLLIMGITGAAAQCRSSRRQARTIILKHRGVGTGKILGSKWAKGRFRMPYLRESLWQQGYLVDTVETATNWGNVDGLISAAEGSIRSTLAADGEKVVVYTHLSHVYPQGSSCYTTYIFRPASTYDETYQRWQRIKSAVSLAIVEHGGTISHQHGVGKDHKPFLAKEKNPLGMTWIESMIKTADPGGILNPGTLL